MPHRLPPAHPLLPGDSRSPLEDMVSAGGRRWAFTGTAAALREEYGLDLVVYEKHQPKVVKF